VPPVASAGAADLRVLDCLGGGGFAEVWRAARPDGRSVALKMLKQRFRERRGARACLEREHRLLAELEHPRVVRSFGLVEIDGALAIELEYLDGGDLVPLAGAAPKHWTGAALDVIAALEHLHARGFVHRDVKARNVLFGADGRARLIDFASVLPIGASASKAGATAAHRPPGSAGGATSARDDVYALAVLLYQLLAGRLPYGAHPASELAGRLPDAPLPADAEPRLGRMARLITGAIAAKGAIPGGLSAIRDVLESADVTTS
jgi:serine/threonine-protein kinase